MKIFSTRLHGILDYSFATVVFTLPRAYGWSDRATRLMTGAALFTLAYSMLTRYELGLVRVLPMKAHLAIDALDAVFFLAAPFLLLDEEPGATAPLVGLGLFGLSAALLTESESSAG